MDTGKNHFLSEWENHFSTHRSALLSYAFRMTGSLAEAEDIVQDVFLQCADVNPETLASPKAWLMKVCSNKGIDHLKRAYQKRETYPGTWLPDAVPDSFQLWDHLKSGAPADSQMALSESLTTSFLLLVIEPSLS